MAVSAPAVESAIAFPRLPAKIGSFIRAVLTDDHALLDELSHGFGGPFHLLFPDQFAANVEAFRAELSERGVDHRVFYAKKANKAACWVERCAAAGIGVDVASLGELREALSHGVAGPNIGVTGPAKVDDLLRLAILHGCLTAIDSLDELDRFTELTRVYGRGRILLRCLPTCQPYSRFGLDEAELAEALVRCRNVMPRVKLEGFSFHLSGYAVQPRADLAAQLLRHCRTAQSFGLPATCVNIGGGFAVSYVSAQDWARFRETQSTTHFHAGRCFTEFYPYHAPIANAGMLGAILDATPAGETHSLGTLLRRDGVTLLLEPGRALLDQAGITVFRIQGVKSRDYGILTLDGTSLSLSEQWFNSEFLPDPVVISRNEQPSGAIPFAACIGGASCLETDMLTWRKILFPFRPQVGDLLVYLNTAGYQMDSNESPFHDLPLPPKVIIDRDGRWRLDRHRD